MQLPIDSEKALRRITNAAHYPLVVRGIYLHNWRVVKTVCLHVTLNELRAFAHGLRIPDSCPRDKLRREYSIWVIEYMIASHEVMYCTEVLAHVQYTYTPHETCTVHYQCQTFLNNDSRASLTLFV